MKCCECGKEATIEQLDLFGCSVAYCVRCHRDEGTANEEDVMEMPSIRFEGVQISAFGEGYDETRFDEDCVT